MAWSTTELLAAIRQRGRIPSSDPSYTDANLLLEADWQMAEALVPTIMGARSDYYVATDTQALVADQQGYPIPEWCIASVPRLVHFIDSSDRAHELPFLPLGDSYAFEGQTGQPQWFTVRDDELLLLPTPATATGSVRLHCEYRPGRLVVTASAAQATAIESGEVSCGSVPAIWSTSDTYDIIKGTPPFATLARGLAATDVSTGASGSVTFASADVPDRLAAGDYVSLSGESPVPQIPAEGHPVLALAVAKEVRDEMGDPGAMRMAEKLSGAVERFRRMLTPRVKGKQQKITSPNSALRARRGGRRFAYSS